MNPHSGVRGRVAVVTGSTRGLGFAMARLLGRQGATVVLGSRSGSAVAAAVDRLRAEGITVAGRACDTGELSDVEALRDDALRQGGLDIWVNNAGISGVFGPTASTPVDDFTRVVRTNILGTFHGSRVALPVLLAQGHGHLVNVYGQGDQGPVALQNAYASSKRWVRQFTETLQRETRGTGVQVHGLNPGLVRTDLLRQITSQPGYEQRLDALPLVVALWGQTAEEAAGPLLDLVTSDAAEFRDLTKATLVTRGLRNLLAGRLRRANRMPLDVSVLGRDPAWRRSPGRLNTKAAERATMTDNAEHRLNPAGHGLDAREDELVSPRDLSDGELLAQLADTVRMEKALVQRWTASGDCYILSGSGKVHLPTCASVSAVVDRDAAWAPYLDDVERVRDWHGTDNAPPMPALMTRADIEELTRYTSCPECAPALDHTEKRPSVRGWTALKAGSLNFRHFGIPFSLVEGAEIGALIKLSRVETADGLDFAAEFDGIADPVTDPLAEVMFRTGAVPQAS